MISISDTINQVMEKDNSFDFYSPKKRGSKTTEVKESDRDLLEEHIPIGPKMEDKILKNIIKNQYPKPKRKSLTSRSADEEDSFQSELETKNMQGIEINERQNKIQKEKALETGGGEKKKKNISFNVVEEQDKERSKRLAMRGDDKTKSALQQTPKTASQFHLKENPDIPLCLTKMRTSGKSENKQNVAVIHKAKSLPKYKRPQPSLARGGAPQRRKAKLKYKFADEFELRTKLFEQRVDRFVRNLRLHSGRNDTGKLSQEKLKIINDKVGVHSELLPDHPRFNHAKNLQKKLEKAGKFRLERQNRFSLMKKKAISMLYFAHEYFRIFEYWAINIYSLFDEKVPVFKHLGNFKFFWEILLFLITMWNLISLSLEISFAVTKKPGISFYIPYLNDEQALLAINAVCLTLFTLDIMLKFNTGIYKNGEPIYDRKKIAKNYLATGFAFDILSTLPFWLDILNSHSEIVHYFLFLKIYPLQTFFKNINEAFLNFEGKFEAVYQLLKLLLTLLLVFHICACVWHYQAQEAMSSNNWIIKQELQNSHWSERYIRSLYFIVVTMTTVGYGDVTPSNTLEYLIAITCLLISCCLVGYSISSIGVILKKKNKLDAQYRDKMQLINTYLNKNRVDESLKLRLRKYLEYIWKIEKSASEKECDELIKELPSSLREELLTQTRFWALQGIFSQKFKKGTLSKLAKTLSLVHYSKEEWLFQEGDMDSDLYVIMKGELEIVFNAHNTSGKNIIKVSAKGEGDIVGIESFFLDCSKQISARAATTCSILKLNRKNFLEIVKDSPEDYEQFCFMRDKILLCNEWGVVGENCDSCGEATHTVKNCPYLTYKPFKHIIIKKHLYSEPQKRLYIKRQSKNLREKFKNALSQNELVLKSVKDYQEEMFHEVEVLSEKYASYLESMSFCRSGFDFNFGIKSEETLGNRNEIDDSFHTQNSFKEEDLCTMEENIKGLKPNEPFKRKNHQQRPEGNPEPDHKRLSHQFDSFGCKINETPKNIAKNIVSEHHSSGDLESGEYKNLSLSPKRKEDKQRAPFKLSMNIELSSSNEESKDQIKFDEGKSHFSEAENKEDSDIITANTSKTAPRSKFRNSLLHISNTEKLEEIAQRHSKPLKNPRKSISVYHVNNTITEFNEEADAKTFKSTRTLQNKKLKFGSPLYDFNFEVANSYVNYFPEGNKDKVLRKLMLKRKMHKIIEGFQEILPFEV